MLISISRVKASTPKGGIQIVDRVLREIERTLKCYYEHVNLQNDLHKCHAFSYMLLGGSHKLALSGRHSFQNKN
jgi:hypothetical protein